MASLDKENKVAFMTCVELVLMKRGNTNYHLAIAKLHTLYDCELHDCIDHPERLKTVLKEVYKEEYSSVLDEISWETDRLEDIDKFKSEFFKFMKS